MFFNLGSQVSGIATDSIGLSGADLDAMNASVASAAPNATGTALDQIQAAAWVTPDLVKESWIVHIYATVADVAGILFMIFFIAGLTAMVLKRMNMLPPSIGAEVIHHIKKTLVAGFMIMKGMPVIMTILLSNQWLSEVFGGSISVIELLVWGLVSPLGCIVVVASCAAVAWNAVFYLCRLAIVYLFIGIWPIAWVLWMFDKTAHIGVRILIIGIVNIFLGAGMCFLYWIGAQFILYHGGGLLTMWGHQIIGLIFMYLAYKLPGKAYKVFVSRSPTIVNVVVNKAAGVAVAAV